LTNFLFSWQFKLLSYMDGAAWHDSNPFSDKTTVTYPSIKLISVAYGLSWIIIRIRIRFNNPNLNPNQWEWLWAWPVC